MSCACLDASLTPSETGPELVLISDFLYPRSGKVEAKQDFLRMKLRGTKKTLLITESFLHLLICYVSVNIIKAMGYGGGNIDFIPFFIN